MQALILHRCNCAPHVFLLISQTCIWVHDHGNRAQHLRAFF
jgi:hypothetical protein